MVVLDFGDPMHASTKEGVSVTRVRMSSSQNVTVY